MRLKILTKFAKKLGSLSAIYDSYKHLQFYDNGARSVL